MAQRKLGGGVIALIVLNVILLGVLVVLIATHPRSGDGDTQADQDGATEQTTDEGDDNGQGAQDDESGGEDSEPDQDVAPAPDGALDQAAFALPSGNIWCDLGDEGVDCFIAGYDFEAPEEEGCDGEVGPALRVDSDGVTLPCVTEDVPQSAPDGFTALDYGEATSVGGYWCASSESGVRCVDAQTGSGFTLARSGYSTF